MSGLQGIGNHDLERIVPADDVEAFPPELVDDVLDAAAADADAGSHTVHFKVDTGDGNFGPIARLAAEGLNFNRSVRDFRNLIFKQSPNKIRVSARQDYLDSLADFSHIEDHGFDSFADMMRFSGNLLAARQNRLRFSQTHRRRSTFKSLHGSMDKVSLHGDVFVESGVTFGFANLLNHHLLGALGGNSTQKLRVDDLLSFPGADFT